MNIAEDFITQMYARMGVSPWQVWDMHRNPRMHRLCKVLVLLNVSPTSERFLPIGWNFQWKSEAI